MPTRKVVLTEHQTRLVQNLVDTGRYQNASAVLREGLRLIEGREAADAARLDALRHAADKGIADIDGGRFQVFQSSTDLNRHLPAVADRILARDFQESDG